MFRTVGDLFLELGLPFAGAPGSGPPAPSGAGLPLASRGDACDASSMTPDVLTGTSKAGLAKRSIVTSEETSGSGGRSSLERPGRRRCIRTQFSVDLQRINVCFLQLSTVEDVVTLESIMNSVKDLTCVSLLAFCFDHVSFQFLINRETNYLGAPLEESVRECKEGLYGKRAKGREIRHF